MNINHQIKSRLSEAELYRAQGLFSEAIDKYHDASALIDDINGLKNKSSLLKAISEKIQAIEKRTQKVETGTLTPALSEKGQNLIKNLFGESSLQKAIALAKFGQFDRAIVEFTELLEEGAYRVDAGKHILRCMMSVGSVDDAVAQYRKWHADDRFQADQLEAIRAYLQPIAVQKGITTPLPVSGVADDPDKVGAQKAEIEFNMPESQEEILDITSIGICFTNGSQKGKMVEFDVNFQSGEMLSLIIPKNDSGVIEALKDGDHLEEVQFYSPIAMFKGTAVIAQKTQIETGPKQGDFCLDLKITGT